MTSAPTSDTDGALQPAVDPVAILHELPVMYAFWDTSVRNLLANRAFRRWFGTAAGQTLRGSHLGDLVPPDLYERLLPHVSLALAGESAESEVPMFDAEGSLHQMHLVLVPHRTRGDVRGFSMLCTDITDRVRAREAERRVAHEVATFMERERISERLHQDALQQLFGVMIILRSRSEDPAMARAVSGLEEVIADLRGIGNQAGASEGDGEAAAPWQVRELVEVLDKLPAIVSIWSNDLRVRFTNATGDLWMGHSRVSSFGMTAEQYLGPELYATNLPLMRAVLAGQEQRFVRLLGPDDGPKRVVQMQYVPNRVGSEVDGFFVLGTDLTELVEARSTLRETQADVDEMSRAYLTLAQANRAVLRAEDDLALFSEICRISVECGGYLGAWVGAADDTGQVAVLAQAGSLTEYVAGLTISVDPDDPRGRGPTGTALREGHPVYSANFLQDPATAPWRSAAQTHHIAASASIPLLRGGSTVAVLNLYSDDATHFSPSMRGLMEGLADNVAFALASLEDRRRLRRLTGEAP